MIINPYIYSVGTAYDPDAQAFITATGISGTNATATNQLVLDLKAANIWTKMKAVYPMVGGTATTCKFNLKNPVDSNAAYRLTFFGGGTFSANGYQPNGTNAYANTFFNPNGILGLNSTHISYYSRTNIAEAGYDLAVVENVGGANINIYNILILRYTGNSAYFGINVNEATIPSASISNSDSRGLFVSNRTASNVLNGFRNSTKIFNSSIASIAVPNKILYLGAVNSIGPQFYSSKECAFASIGDGLTDLESQLFYQITEKYQVALGRNINPTQSFYYNSAYNNETNAFLFSTQITDNTIQTATNTLVSDLKTANIFTKMKAVYPMVGGTATTHKFNLINPQDSTAAFALSFVGGWTHSANGALPNGTNAYADTFFIPAVNGTLNSSHISFYSRTNTDGVFADFAGANLSPNGATILYIKSSNVLYGTIDLYPNTTPDYIQGANTDARGFYCLSRTASNLSKAFKNNSILATQTNSGNRTFSKLLISTNNSTQFSNRECAFASIGDGLSDAEALALYNAVNSFQVSLARNV